MQREDVERLAHAATMLGLQITDERHKTLREHHENTAAALRALLAERDAVFAAGQKEMRERAAKLVVGLTHSVRLGHVLLSEQEEDLALRPIRETARSIRALTIKDRDHQSL